jgi:hypothetical protein
MESTTSGQPVKRSFQIHELLRPHSRALIAGLFAVTGEAISRLRGMGSNHGSRYEQAQRVLSRWFHGLAFTRS